MNAHILLRASSRLDERQVYSRDRNAEARREIWRQWAGWPLTIVSVLFALIFAGMVWLAWFATKS